MLQMVASSFRLAVLRESGSDSLTAGVVSLFSSRSRSRFLINESAIRRVLDLKMVTQCAMLQDFGVLLVLTNKVFPTSILPQAMFTSTYLRIYLRILLNH